MRLWSLHPGYLDRAGLLALWRESLLAQKVLRGETRGYRHHPQLERFRSPGAIQGYLWQVHHEGARRGYWFKSTLINIEAFHGRIPITAGQLVFERGLLEEKLRLRGTCGSWHLCDVIIPNGIFTICQGPKATWEKGNAASMVSQFL